MPKNRHYVVFFPDRQPISIAEARQLPKLVFAMDRSRIIVALALLFTIFSLIIGIANISFSGRASRFASETENLLSSGKAGIALIPIQGVISEEPGAGVNADRTVAKLKNAADEPGVRAVILAVNSPGGAVGATKKVYDQVVKLRDKKPVVAVISDIAASGGYYIASAADSIIAYEGSLVGSIGVISFHMNVASLLEKYGVRVRAFKAGRFKDASYPFRAMTPEELDMRNKLVQAAYGQFLIDVVNGRKKNVTITEVRNTWAGGRIFSGGKAKELRMIDEIAEKEPAMDLAVDMIKKKLKTTDDLPIMRPRREFLDELRGILPFSAKARAPEDRLRRHLFQSPVLYLYPTGPAAALELLRLPSRN